MDPRDVFEAFAFGVVLGGLLMWGIVGIVTNHVTGGARWGDMPTPTDRPKRRPAA